MGLKDSYSEWLGVTTPKRPLNHYQLLGLKESVSDQGLIEEAARRQIEKLKQYGKRSRSDGETAERLLLEVQRAQYVLTDSGRKAEYDRWLKETREKGAPRGVHMSLVAAEQELITKRDRAVERQQWGQAEELARKLVVMDPKNPDHTDALQRIQERGARIRRSATVSSAAKSIVLVVILVGVVILSVNLIRHHRSGEDSETSAPASGTTGDRPTSTEGSGGRSPTGRQADTGDRRATDSDAQTDRAAKEERRAEARTRAKKAETQADWQAASQAYQELIDLGAGKDVEARLQAVKSAGEAEELEKAGKFEEALAAYQQAVEGLADRSEVDQRIAALEAKIVATRPQLRY